MDEVDVRIGLEKISPGALAGMRLARDEEHLAPLAPSNPLGGVDQSVQSAVASHNTSRRANGQTTRQGQRGSATGSSKRFPSHFDGLDGIGQALQGQLPEGPVFMTTAPSGGQSHPRCRQDMSPVAHGAQARCFNDRIPKAIVVLSGYFPTAEAHAQAHGMFSAGYDIGEIPDEEPTGCSRHRLSRSTPCCIATAQARAADAEANITMSSSPKFFTSLPPASATAWRRIDKCPRRTSSAASGDNCCDNSVDPTTSVKRIVALSMAKRHLPA